MRIIDNLTTTHTKGILSIINSDDSMVLVSPFLTGDFYEIIHDIASLGVKRIVLVTTLNDDSTDLFNKANSLRSLHFACADNGIDYEVRIDNKLHGKIYIALENDIPKRGIITSANLTSNGLRHNHEWGIEIDDSNALRKVIEDVYSVSSPPLSFKELNDIYSVIDAFQRNNPKLSTDKVSLKVNHLFKKPILPVTVPITEDAISFPNDTRYFIKPIGSTDDHIDETWVVGKVNHEMHFSKRRPIAVRPGDILICYAVGTTKLLGYFKVLNEPFLLQDEETRWPWAVNTENLCPDYSSKWYQFNNTLSNISSLYGLGKELSYVGGKSLGALNFGADKIRLNESFAHYLIDTIENEVKK